MQKVTVGRTVLFFPNKFDGQARSNNAEVLPAVVVSVGDTESGSCNLRVFQDGTNLPWRTSVMHKDSAQKGQSYWDWPVQQKATEETSGQSIDLEALKAEITEEIMKGIASSAEEGEEVNLEELKTELKKELMSEFSNDLEESVKASLLKAMEQQQTASVNEETKTEEAASPKKEASKK